MGADYEMRGLAPGLNYFVRVKVSHEKAGVGNTTTLSMGILPVLHVLHTLFLANNHTHPHTLTSIYTPTPTHAHSFLRPSHILFHVYTRPPTRPPHLLSPTGRERCRRLRVLHAIHPRLWRLPPHLPLCHRSPGRARRARVAGGRGAGRAGGAGQLDGTRLYRSHRVVPHRCRASLSPYLPIHPFLSPLTPVYYLP